MHLAFLLGLFVLGRPSVAASILRPIEALAPTERLGWEIDGLVALSVGALCVAFAKPRTRTVLEGWRSWVPAALLVLLLDLVVSSLLLVLWAWFAGRLVPGTSVLGWLNPRHCLSPGQFPSGDLLLLLVMVTAEEWARAMVLEAVVRRQGGALLGVLLMTLFYLLSHASQPPAQLLGTAIVGGGLYSVGWLLLRDWRPLLLAHYMFNVLQYSCVD